MPGTGGRPSAPVLAGNRGFAAIVRGQYHVIITLYGDSKGLYVGFGSPGW